jgi:hypothetical protein
MLLFLLPIMFVFVMLNFMLAILGMHWAEQQHIRDAKEKEQKYSSQYGHPLVDVVAGLATEGRVAVHNSANSLGWGLRVIEYRLGRSWRKVKAALTGRKRDIVSETDNIAKAKRNMKTKIRAVLAMSSSSVAARAGSARKSKAGRSLKRMSMFVLEAMKEERQRNQMVATSTLQSTIAYIVEAGRERAGTRGWGSRDGMLSLLLQSVRSRQPHISHVSTRMSRKYSAVLDKWREEEEQRVLLFTALESMSRCRQGIEGQKAGASSAPDVASVTNSHRQVGRYSDDGQIPSTTSCSSSLVSSRLMLRQVGHFPLELLKLGSIAEFRYCHFQRRRFSTLIKSCRYVCYSLRKRRKAIRLHWWWSRRLGTTST